jgi:hypothetical protein
MMALMLGLGAVPALAETPAAVPGLSTLLADIGTMQYEAKLQLNPSAVAMVMNITGQSADEATMGLVNTLVSAVNKLKFNVLADQSGMSLVIGTDKAPLMDLQAAMNAETFDNQITTSMLPGLALSVDPAMMQKVMGQASSLQVDPEKTMQIVKLHLDTIGGLVKEIAEGFTPEEGSFTVEGYGTFTKRTQVTLTTHMMADLLQKMADIYNGAPVHKEFMEKILSASNALPEGADAVSEIPDLGKQMDEAAKKGKTEPDMAVLTGWVYEGENATYIDAMTPPEAGNQTKLDLLFENKGSQIRIKVIGKGFSYTAEETEPAAAPDWAAIEKDILGGQNYTDTLVNVTISNTAELPQMSTTVTADIIATGMNVGLKVNAANRLDTLEGKFDISLSLMSPEPMLTFSVSSKPSDEQPAAPVLEGAAPIILKEDGMSEEENGLLMASLQKALPELFEKLPMALPEEGPALLQMIQEMMITSVEEVPAGEPQPEVSVEPAPVNP